MDLAGRVALLTGDTVRHGSRIPISADGVTFGSAIANPVVRTKIIW